MLLQRSAVSYRLAPVAQTGSAAGGGSHNTLGWAAPGSTRLLWEETATIAAAAYSSSATANEEKGAGSSRRTWHQLANA